MLFDTFFFALLLLCAFIAFAQWRLTRDQSILWYIGYLLFSFAHYGRQFWITGWQDGLLTMPPPDPPLRWDSALSYAAFACYFAFLHEILDIVHTAPLLSKWLKGTIQFFMLGIVLHLLVQIGMGAKAADQAHKVFQIVLLPAMVWILAHLLRYTRFFYQKLILVGTVAVVFGFLSVLATRHISGRYDLIDNVICCFPTRWGYLPLYHLKVGIAIDVICFSWALTLRQKMLLVQPPTIIVEKEVIMPVTVVPEDAFLQKIDAALRENYHKETFHVRELAACMHLAPDVVTRKLKDKMGLTAEQYILHYRLDRALELLRSTDKSAGEISITVGFKEVAHFSRAFKKRYGQTPGEMRRSRDKNDG